MDEELVKVENGTVFINDIGEEDAPGIGWHNAGHVEDAVINWPQFAEIILQKAGG